jgi:hypothetical protein
MRTMVAPIIKVLPPINKRRPTTSSEEVAGQLPLVEEPAMPIRVRELASFRPMESKTKKVAYSPLSTICLRRVRKDSRQIQTCLC